MTVRDKVKSVVLSNIIDFKSKKIGIEEECIIYNEKGNRLPVNKGTHFSSTELLEIINNKSKKNGLYTIEPGGQLEWSSHPHRNLKNLDNSFQKHKSILLELVEEYKLKLISYATEPNFSPENIDLIKQSKYQVMDKHMQKKGTLGKWMMRNSASIQINFDIAGQQDIEEMAFIADCLHPIAAYLFSNSPFKMGEPVGVKNLRNIIWEDTDVDRCRNLFDHKIVSSSGLLDSYIDYFLKVPALFDINEQNEYNITDNTIGENLQILEDKNKLYEKDIKVALQQIFTNVRLKHVLEVRGCDRTPFGFELAPVSFWVGILTDLKTRNEVIEVLKKWSTKDRYHFNKSASILDDSQEGPMGKSYRYWNKWASQLSLDGLRNRKSGEEVYLETFLESVFKNGPYSIQLQLN